MSDGTPVHFEKKPCCQEMGTEKKQMVKIDKMLTFIGNIIMVDTVQWKLLFAKRHKSGRLCAIKKLVDFLAASTSDLCSGKIMQISTSQTVTNWVNECSEAGRNEPARHKEDAEHGRSSVHEPTPEYLIVWLDRMDNFYEAIKSTRYNTQPFHLQGKLFLVSPASRDENLSSSTGTHKQELDKTASLADTIRELMEMGRKSIFGQSNSCRRASSHGSDEHF